MKRTIIQKAVITTIIHTAGITKVQTARIAVAQTARIIVMQIIHPIRSHFGHIAIHPMQSPLMMRSIAMGTMTSIAIADIIGRIRIRCVIGMESMEFSAVEGAVVVPLLN
jgi:hypothetical protein